MPVLNKEEALDTLRTRETLEKYALEAFMKRLNTAPELLDEIEQSIKYSEEMLNKNDLDAFSRADVLIHEIIRNNCGSLWALHFLEQIWYMFTLVRKMDANSDVVKFAKRSISEHKKLLRLMKKGDIEETVICLSKHLQHQQKRLDVIFDETSEKKN